MRSFRDRQEECAELPEGGDDIAGQPVNLSVSHFRLKKVAQYALGDKTIFPNLLGKSKLFEMLIDCFPLDIFHWCAPVLPRFQRKGHSSGHPLRVHLVRARKCLDCGAL